MQFKLMCRVHNAYVCNDSFMLVGNLKVHQCVYSVEHSYCFDVYNEIFSNTSNLNEVLLFEIRLCYTYF